MLKKSGYLPEKLRLPESPNSEIRRLASGNAVMQRVNDGEARLLMPREQRIELAFRWFDEFHTTTRSLLLHVGLTARDLTDLAVAGYIESERRTYRPTINSKARTIVTVTLSRAGLMEKKFFKFPAAEIPSSAIPDLSLTHDLHVQAYISELFRRGEAIDFLGAAKIRNKALKVKSIREAFDLTMFRSDDTKWRAWKYDGLIRLNTGDIEALELERTPKVKPIEQQRFFDKIYSSHEFNSPILILTESEALKRDIEQKLADWRKFGRPLLKDQKSQNYGATVLHKGMSYDKDVFLTDARTAVAVVDSVILEAITSANKNPSGKSGRKRVATGIPSVEQIKQAEAEADRRYEQQMVGFRTDELEHELSKIHDQHSNTSMSDWPSMESVLEPLIYPKNGAPSPLAIFTLEQFRAFTENSWDHEKHKRKKAEDVYWTWRWIQQLARMAFVHQANQRAKDEKSDKPRKKTIFGFGRSSE